MSLDGIVTRNIVYELNKELVNGRIDKVYQDNDFQLLINVRASGDKKRLFISASANQPRIFLRENREFNNPIDPPPFCMLLRKHLENGKILGVRQYKMDRIISIDINSIDELGMDKSKSLVIELMGKYSNIILIDNEDNKIIDAIKRINFSLSSVREILPGIIYDPNDISSGLDPTEDYSLIDLINNSKKDNGSKNIKRFLMSTFTGISPQLCNELEFKTEIDFDRSILSLNEEEIYKINDKFKEIFKIVSLNKFTPLIVTQNGRNKNFYSLDIEFIDRYQKHYYDTISEVLEKYYYKKNVMDAISSKSINIRKIINKEVKKTKRKIAKQSNELNEALNRDKYKVYADLISSNFYQIKKGMKEIELENFYDNMKTVKVPLDEKLDAPQNAAKYYKKYSKLKSAASFLEKQISEGNSEIDYLESVLLNLELSDNLSDIEEIKEELIKYGYIKKKNRKSNQKNKLKKDNILKFETDDGFTIYVGKNNKQNDEITFKIANKRDLWFHVKEAPGSHVVLKDNGKDFTENSLLMAASLAAKYSSLSKSNNIPVDYTFRVNVKRHPANKLGLVNYINYKTINVNKNSDIYKKIKD